METAITLKNELSLAELYDPGAAADLVLYLGLQDMPKNGTSPQKIETDEEGLVLWVEPERDYVRRVWPTMDWEHQSQATYLGLRKASAYQAGLEDGIALTVFRSWETGVWVPTAEEPPSDNVEGLRRAFRTWVGSTVTAEGKSQTYATKLTHTIFNLTWMRDNGFDSDLPKDDGNNVDLEIVFKNREFLERWMRVYAKIKTIRENSGEVDPEKVEEAVNEISDKVTDPNADTNDLDDAGKQTPQLPKIEIEIDGRDKHGKTIFTGSATSAQLKLLKSRTKRIAAWYLKGEEYNRSEMTLMRYRRQWSYICTSCGVEHPHQLKECPACGETDTIIYHEVWSEQTYTDDAGWSEWYTLEGSPVFEGAPEGAPLVDEDLRVEYVQEWIKP